MKPKIFIGCATESLDIALAIQSNLEDRFEIRIWHQGIIEPGSNIVDQLIAFTREYMFGIFVFSADQQTLSRGVNFMQTAANTIFEAGLFAGALGKERAFVVREKNANLELPSDFAGIARATFERPDDADALHAHLARASSDIARAIGKQLRKKPNGDALAAKKAEVERALQLLCNAMAAPGLPESYGIRAFVFELSDSVLINKYRWSRFNDLEREGALRFDIKDRQFENLVVVRAVNSPRPVSELINRSAQADLSKGIQVASEIRFVVASDIRDSDGRVRGVVDLDCVKNEGIEVLQSDGAGSVLRDFAALLHRIGAV